MAYTINCFEKNARKGWEENEVEAKAASHFMGTCIDSKQQHHSN